LDAIRRLNGDTRLVTIGTWDTYVLALSSLSSCAIYALALPDIATRPFFHFQASRRLASAAYSSSDAIQLRGQDEDKTNTLLALPPVRYRSNNRFRVRGWLSRLPIREKYQFGTATTPLFHFLEQHHWV